jgi:F-type H+-transporting ATPase subunit epsilon
MKGIKTNILTPNGPVFKGLAEGVNLPGTEGAFEVKFNHASLMSMLDIGKVIIRSENGKEEVFSLNGGFVEVHKNEVTVFAESAERKDQIDIERARRAKESLERQIRKESQKDIHMELALKRAINRIKVAEL